MIGGPEPEHGEPMDQRITFRPSPEAADALDELVEAGVYANRSEAIREAIVDHASSINGEGDEQVR